MRLVIGRSNRIVGELARPRAKLTMLLVGELSHGSPPIFGLVQSRMDERQWRSYAPSAPLTRESGPWTVTMSMGNRSLDTAVTVLPELLLPMSLSRVATRRPEQNPSRRI
jgi:hypothetical protein